MALCCDLQRKVQGRAAEVRVLNMAFWGSGVIAPLGSARPQLGAKESESTCKLAVMGQKV